jgi:hypothetical protein
MNDYDYSIEKHYHPENFEPEPDDYIDYDLMETEDLCPRCHAYLFTGQRANGNSDDDGIQFWMCKKCDYAIEE